MLAGQTGVGLNAPQRLDALMAFRANDKHKIRFGASAAKLGIVRVGESSKSLGQFSVQATDEWKFREGVILVFGFDYSKFLGAGKDFSLTPRLGFMYDVDSKTRVRSAFTAQGDQRSWSHAVGLEDTTIAFRDPVAVEDIVVENGKAKMSRSSRLEFGIERLLDKSSSVEANVFFDTTSNRGVGLASFGFNSPADAEFSTITGNQNGRAQGLRVVYSRRINGTFNASAGYSLGLGQKFSETAITEPSELFRNDIFQSVFGEVDADFHTGTNVRTIFRLSPKATVFAIDPFQGRLAIYDPSLSVLVTQDLPTFGLPFRAEASIDARNLFDFQSGLFNEDGSLKVTSQRRAVRGAILFRF